MVLPGMKQARSRFLLSAATLLACAPVRVAAQAALTPIRLGLVPNDDATTVLYASAKGLFRAAGLDVQLEPATNGGAITAAVAGGSYDIGKATLASLFDAHVRGIPFSILAPAGFYEKSGELRATGLIVNKSIGPNDGAGLNDKVIAVASLNDLGRVSAAAWADQNGGNWRSQRFVELPMTEGAAAIAQGRISAAECAMPALQVALDGGNVRFVPMADAIGPAYLYTAWFTTRDWSRSQTQAARAFARVIAEAAAYTNSHHAETAAMVAQASKLNPSIVERMRRWSAATSVSLPSVQIPLDAAAKYGTIARSFPAEELIDANAIVR